MGEKDIENFVILNKLETLEKKINEIEILLNHIHSLHNHEL